MAVGSMGAPQGLSNHQSCRDGGKVGEEQGKSAEHWCRSSLECRGLMRKSKPEPDGNGKRKQACYRRVGVGCTGRAPKQSQEYGCDSVGGCRCGLDILLRLCVARLFSGDLP